MIRYLETIGNERNNGTDYSQVDNLLTAVKKFNEALELSQESAGCLINILTNFKQQDCIVPDDRADLIDAIQQLLYLETKIGKVKDAFNHWDALSSPARGTDILTVI